MAAKYDSIADWYDMQVKAGALLHDLALPALLDLCGTVTGATVCDFACGQGIVARMLAERGAVVTGVDLSPRLLALARQYEAAAPLGITYLVGDALRLDAVADARFDGVVCNLALMDIPDLTAALTTVARILAPGGWFVFAITHPCFEMPAAHWLTEAEGTISRVVRGYFAEGEWQSANPGGVRGMVGAHHRTLGTYLNALVAAGLILTEACEPVVTGDLAIRLPGYHEVPALFLAHCRNDADG